MGAREVPPLLELFTMMLDVGLAGDSAGGSDSRNFEGVEWQCLGRFDAVGASCEGPTADVPVPRTGRLTGPSTGSP